MRKCVGRRNESKKRRLRRKKKLAVQQQYRSSMSPPCLDGSEEFEDAAQISSCNNENITAVPKMSKLNGSREAVTNPHCLNVPFIDSANFSNSMNFVKIEIDNPELSCNDIIDGTSCFWYTKSPLEYIEVKTEVSESEYTRREFGSKKTTSIFGKDEISYSTYKSSPVIMEDVGVDVVKLEVEQDTGVTLDSTTTKDNAVLKLNVLSTSLDGGEKQSKTPDCVASFSPESLHKQTGEDHREQFIEGPSRQANSEERELLERVQNKQSDIQRPSEKPVNSNPFQCQACDRKFSSYTKLNCHCIADHDMCNIYKCTLCSKEFGNESEYKSHRWTHFEYDYMINYSSCPICCIEFSKREDLDRHLVCHTSAVTVLCKSDDACNSGPQQGRTQPDTSHLCPVCKNIYQASQDLMEHIKSHQKPFKCSECDEAYYNHGLLVRHMSDHPVNKRSIACPDCNKTFNTIHNFRKHHKCHVKPFKCSECNREFGSRTNYNRHMNTHTAESRAHLCSVCGKCYSSKCNLAIHLRIHAGVKPYRCTQCGKAFSQQHILKSHLRMHSGENPYACHLCSKAYRHKISLKLHMKKHPEMDKLLSASKSPSGDPVSANDSESVDDENLCIVDLTEVCNTSSKNGVIDGDESENRDVHEAGSHFCAQCGKGCKTGPGLKRHILSHGREKKIYQCKVCGKVSTTNGNLAVHMRIHTGEKPYTCAVCNKSYRQSHLLKYHMVRHSQIAPTSTQVASSYLEL